MPIPEEQMRRLVGDLRAHEMRARELKESIRLQQEEASLHELVVRLGRDKKLHEALGALHDEPDLAAKISANPQPHFEKHGVHLPAGTEVSVLGTGLGSICVEAHFGHGPYRVRAVWESRGGFSLDVIGAPAGPRPTETVYVQDAPLNRPSAGEQEV